MNDYKLAIEIKVTTTPVDSLGSPKQQDLFVETQKQTTLFSGTKEEIQSMLADAVLPISRQWMLSTNEPPIVNIGDSVVTGNRATVTGQVDAQSLSTVITLEYGPTIELGSSLAANESPLSGEGMADVTFSVTDLAHETGYFYRIKAVSAGGTVYSNIKTLTTPQPLIQLTVEYDGITQFDFKFKAPATSNLVITDGDGTHTAVAGQDDTLVTHTTSYASAGIYYFYIEGDYLDITQLAVISDLVTMDISRLGSLVNLTACTFNGNGIFGDISELSTSSVLSNVTIQNTLIHGDMTTLVNVTAATFNNTNVSGNLSKISAWPITIFISVNAQLTFDSVVSWTLGGTFFASGQNWTPTMVDNCLISLALGGTTGQTINIGGNNAARSSASNAAMATLIEAGNTVTVNEGGVVGTAPISLMVVYDGITQFDFKFKLPATSNLVITDGDGTHTVVAGQDDTLVTHTTSYASAGTYYFYIEGDYLDLTVINVSLQEFVSGDVSGWGTLINLTEAIGVLSGLYGNIDSFVNLTSLVLINFAICPGIIGNINWAKSITTLDTFRLQGTGLSGDASELFGLTLMEHLILNGDKAVTFDFVTVFNMTGSIYLHDCNLTSTMVDNALKSFVNLTGCNIDLGGNNAPMTAASADAYLTLLANGNTVTVNQTLGAELHVGPNAASDPNGNEADATTDWVEASALFTSVSSPVSVGSKALCIESNTTPAANARTGISIAVVDTKFYKLSLDWRHVGVGGDWNLTLESVVVGTLGSADVAYTSLVAYMKAADLLATIRFIENNAENDGGVYFDNISFKELL
ncbi:MAG: hypothetical protein DRI83_02435 [Bacteroidetes bacterium]|nr:MAG: hypothetical protein DRI83_02435 [Bacteroidota bacterium]